MQGAETEFWNGRRPYRGIFVEDAMTKIIVLVALTFSLIGFANRASTKASKSDGA